MNSLSLGQEIGTNKVMLSDERVLELEVELRHCREERDAAQKLAGQFQSFSQRVKDYAFIGLDAESRIVSWSSGAEQILGWAEHEILGQLSDVIFTPEDRTRGEDANERATARREGCAEDERWHMRANGSRFWGSGVLTAHLDAAGKLEGYSKVLRDLTSRNAIELQLRISEERFRLFADNVTDYALVQVDTEHNISGWNPGAERIFGYTEKEVAGQDVRLFFTPEDRQKGESEKDLDRALTEGRAEDSRWMVRKDGTRFWSRWVTTPMRDKTERLHGFAKVLRDETERKQSEDLLTRSVQQTELLLREIHHRVKNNLHVITSLLSLQAGQLPEDSKTQRMLDELQDRVRAIASLHEALYSSNNLANIDFGLYLQQLLNELVGFNGVDEERIQVRTEADDVVLSIEQALPLGLIANELVSNAFKHGFPERKSGIITVNFRYLPERVPAGETLDAGWCELSVHDNGTGIADAAGIWELQSMGLRIIQLLSKQLNGELRLDQTNGTRFSVCFPLDTLT